MFNYIHKWMDARIYYDFGAMQIVFVAFTPSLMFAGLAQTVTLQDMISW